MTRLLSGVIVVLLAGLMVTGMVARHYHKNAITYKDQRDTATRKLKQA
ncbi:TPA: lysis protein, partial [Salmonella enterica subsp. enterica serovar Napoli]|nr:lysis protein [Salmonella enterica subsp. enterica serovar Napoli]